MASCRLPQIMTSWNTINFPRIWKCLSRCNDALNIMMSGHMASSVVPIFTKAIYVEADLNGYKRVSEVVT